MKQTLITNLSLKLLALASALGFWFIILGLQDAPRLFETPLEIKPFNLSEQYMVVGKLPLAKVKIRVDREVQKQLRPEDFEVYIDLKDAKPGKTTGLIAVTSKNPKVAIVGVAPESITLDIEKKAEKELTIEQEEIGKVKDGYQIKSIEITPPRVKISGATSLLSSLKKVHVSIALTGSETKSFAINNAILLDQDGKPLDGFKLIPEKIEVRVEVSSTLQEKTVPIKPRFSSSLKNGFLNKMSLKPAVVTIQGEGRALENMSSVETEPIDLEKITKTGTYPVNLQLPRDMKSLTGNKVEIIIEIIELK